MQTEDNPTPASSECQTQESDLMAMTESNAINTPRPTPTALQKDPTNGGTDLSSTQEGIAEEKKKRRKERQQAIYGYISIKLSMASM
ncbi:hypothetical protein PGT21_008203 [Puccinia graminis f. sp. tritici]|uniref:Uncharacterized protein n=1 Tax=Puccinia graminis f. sp. tritici TaxID=56615 RepID=A0A5B0NJP7_PUCGR|nr:hypothetical protein PGTUg99_028990 [Puccinia graminis f. sp. tritici]KAA1101128.1 hypothetical protein PGT21_008203 [Puccinia graminis f. sp. tritici]